KGEITFKGAGNGKGLSIEGTATATITGTTIRGTDGQGKGVLMESSGTLKMERVTISDVAMGVEATAGNLTINGHSTITFKNGDRNYGVRVQNGVTANLTDVRITGGGEGKGVWMEGTGEMTMERVTISDVAMGVEATNGTLTISGHSTITFKNEAGNYGVRVLI
ncbi:right-handed parallel beta-helix repeat-containing protein, partial [Bartonella bovis]|uniref:right-handed parallel beta-helix repeat-containing protein n=1 Tax=Bartonella bovis TaxID=155194 RepID=UPI0011AFC95C